MTEFDDGLAEALGQNGSFDPGKAEELKQNALAAFDAKMKKVERYLRVYLCLCVWLFVFSLFHFFHSSTTKALLFYGLLTFIFFETTVLMKLWYWIMNDKITVLKEIKQLQLARISGDEGDATTGIDRLRGPLRGLSRRERTAWWAALVCGAALVGAVKSCGDTYWQPSSDASLMSRGCVTLAADGSGSAVTELSSVYQGIETRDSFSFFAPRGAVLRVADSHGRELPFTTLLQDGRVRCEVRLMRTVFPGQRFSCTQVQECPDFATHEGGVWTYSTEYSHNYATNEFSETVVLPAGAEIVSVDPWPVASFILSRKPTVRFEATRGRNEPFKCAIQYRLPSQSPAATSP
ncbi:MAG TPA: DUF6768 family protein [Thermoguttaceae bacterium]|nr:DUF6768 family protein [Thermoguttaceae bacterium]